MDAGARREDQQRPDAEHRPRRRRGRRQSASWPPGSRAATPSCSSRTMRRSGCDGASHDGSNDAARLDVASLDDGVGVTCGETEGHAPHDRDDRRARAGATATPSGDVVHSAVRRRHTRSPSSAWLGRSSRTASTRRERRPRPADLAYPADERGSRRRSRRGGRCQLALVSTVHDGDGKIAQAFHRLHVVVDVRAFEPRRAAAVVHRATGEQDPGSPPTGPMLPGE